MGEIIANRELNNRKVQLLRQLENHYISQEDFDAEMPEIERQIRANVVIALQEAEEQLKVDIQEAKAQSVYDGDFKRKIAQMIIGTYRGILSDEELKGMFRQGYKIMRGK